MKLISRIWRAAAAAGLVLSMVPAVPASAAVITWDGGGSDLNLSTAENWVGDVAPVNGDSISIGYDVVFSGGCTADITLNNDLDAGTVTLAGITTTGQKPMNCYYSLVIDGNDINVSGNIDGLGGEGFASLLLEVGLVNITAPATILNTAMDNATIGANNVVFDGYMPTELTGTGNVTYQVTNPGGGGIGCFAYLAPTSDNSGYTGALTIGNDAGLTIDANSNNILRHASSVTKQEQGRLGAILPFGQNMAFGTPLTLNGSEYPISIRQMHNYVNDDCVTPTTNTTMTISSDITFTEETQFSLDHVNVVFTGDITGDEYITLHPASSGSITMGDDVIVPEPYTTNYDDDLPGSFVSVSNNETAVVNGTRGSTYVYSGGTLKGTGTVGALEVYTGGTLAPGESPGCLTSGNLTLTGTFQVEIAGTTVCDQYDQQIVNGTVDVTGATLTVDFLDGFTGANGNTYVIINNDGSADAVTGEFTGLADGATVTFGGAQFVIDYQGGDGNDVVLTQLAAAPGTPDTGFRLLLNNPITTIAITLSATIALAYASRKVRA